MDRREEEGDLPIHRHYSVAASAPEKAVPGSARANGPGAGPWSSRGAELKRGEIQDDQRSQRHEQGPERVHFGPSLCGHRQVP